MVRYLSMFSIVLRINMYYFLHQGKMDFLNWKLTDKGFGRRQTWVRIPMVASQRLELPPVSGSL